MLSKALVYYLISIIRIIGKKKINLRLFVLETSPFKWNDSFGDCSHERKSVVTSSLREKYTWIYFRLRLIEKVKK